MPMYVPTYQGLSALDLLRPAAAGPRAFPFESAGIGFYRARNAIYCLFAALRATKPRLTVLVPDYNSGNEILALQAAGATLHYYRIGRDMQPDPQEIAELCVRYDVDVLYVIHYLGWPQPLDTLSAICRTHDMMLVEDCALSLLSEPGGQALGATGDWSVFCLYKTLPVPNGALLVQNNRPLASLARLNLRSAGAASVLGRIAELGVQRLRGRSSAAGAALQSVKRALGKAAGALDVDRAKVGDLGFNLADVDLGMSGASARLLRGFDFDDIRRKRTTNFRHLASRLEGRVPAVHSHLADGVCPLFFPILVDDKAATARQLNDRGVAALQFWNHGAEGTAAAESPAVRYLRAHVLALPIHQDLSARQLDYMAEHVANLNLKSLKAA
jgi:dTDP-4-amino-4,6-dideoxygalactose transaminase